jgi:hypothetical protein
VKSPAEMTDAELRTAEGRIEAAICGMPAKSRSPCECGHWIHLGDCPTGQRAMRLHDSALVESAFREIARRGEDWVDKHIDAVMGPGWSERERES